VNVGKYLRGEDRHVGTARIVSKAARARAELAAAHPLMQYGRHNCAKGRSMVLHEDHALRYATAVNMKMFGGDFASALAETMLRADMGNRRRIEGAFPELMGKYQPTSTKV
jgi:hypothetical protein